MAQMKKDFQRVLSDDAGDLRPTFRIPPTTPFCCTGSLLQQHSPLSQLPCPAAAALQGFSLPNNPPDTFYSEFKDAIAYENFTLIEAHAGYPPSLSLPPATCLSSASCLRCFWLTVRPYLISPKCCNNCLRL